MPAAAYDALVPGLATGIGSLPHEDARAAVEVTLDVTPRLPAAPQLPNRCARELMIPQWARALPEVVVVPDGSIAIDHALDPGPPDVSFDVDAHGGILAFVELLGARPEPIRRVKVQLAGPLTMGLALLEAGYPPDRAFRRAGEAVRAWIPALEALVASHVPDARTVVFLDEPGLVAWRDHDGPLEREAAVDLLSGALARVAGVPGVHVCGRGDRRLALEAGPQVLGVTVAEDLVDDGGLLSRYLEGDGWVAWGAIPTDGPLGDSGEPLWRRLAGLWCELTRRGCDPARLRTQALVTPECGLAGHGPSQARRALELASLLADRMHDQAVAARLTLGA